MASTDGMAKWKMMSKRPEENCTIFHGLDKLQIGRTDGKVVGTSSWLRLSSAIRSFGDCKDRKSGPNTDKKRHADEMNFTLYQSERPIQQKVAQCDPSILHFVSECRANWQAKRSISTHCSTLAAVRVRLRCLATTTRVPRRHPLPKRMFSFRRRRQRLLLCWPRIPRQPRTH